MALGFIVDSLSGWQGETLPCMDLVPYFVVVRRSVA